MKPKNLEYDRGFKQGYECGLADGEITGVVAGEKRLARAMRRWIVENAEWDTVNGEFTAPEICGILKFLTARAKRGMK